MIDKIKVVEQKKIISDNGKIMHFIKKSTLAALAVVLSNKDVVSFSPSSTTTTTRIAPTCLTPSCRQQQPVPQATQLNAWFTKNEEELLSTSVAEVVSDEEYDITDLSDEKKLELILLGVWAVSISAFILINNATGAWPLFMKQVPERVFFLSHMIGGMLFGGGIILTTCIERAVAKSNDSKVLQFWFTKVPELDGLIVVPALTISMISGTGLSIVRYGGLNVAPPHGGAIFWTLIAFLSWWAATDLTTQGTALKAVDDMYERGLKGEEGLVTPKVVVDRHVSNVVSCFFILLLYSFMVLKPGTLFPFPWNA